MIGQLFTRCMNALWRSVAEEGRGQRGRTRLDFQQRGACRWAATHIASALGRARAAASVTAAAIRSQHTNGDDHAVPGALS